MSFGLALSLEMCISEDLSHYVRNWAAPVLLEESHGARERGRDGWKKGRREGGRKILEVSVVSAPTGFVFLV